MSLRAGQSTQKGTLNMSTREILAGAVALVLALGTPAALSADRPGLGQPVSENELALWDISIGPDGRGLPPRQWHACPGRGCVRAEMRIVPRERGTRRAQRRAQRSAAHGRQLCAARDHDF